MDHEARKQKIIDTANNLIAVKQALDVRQERDPRTKRNWCYLWIAASGACHSLYCAERHIDNAFDQRNDDNDFERDVRTKVDEVNAVIADIARATNPSLANKDTWLLSYYSKGVEVRICQVLERALRLFLNCTDRRVDIINLAHCAVVHLAGKSHAPKAVKVLKGFVKDPRWNKSLEPGKPLRRVWKRVNEFKHKGLQNVDQQDPKYRFTDALYGLYNLSEVFLELVNAR